MKPMFKEETDGEVRCFYCPLCDDYYPHSEYLHGVFEDEPKVEFIANLVTHYRHEHTKYYDNGVGYVSRFHDYDSFKETVNNRAKRQIIRKAKNYLRAVGVTPEDFCTLQSTDQKTAELACRMLPTQEKLIA